MAEGYQSNLRCRKCQHHPMTVSARKYPKPHLVVRCPKCGNEFVSRAGDAGKAANEQTPKLL